MVETRGGVPLSVTRTTTDWNPGPCASVGVNDTRPAGLTVKPGGPETSEKVRVWNGSSVSRAARDHAAGTPSFNTGGGVSSHCGAWLSSVTGILKNTRLANRPSVASATTEATVPPRRSPGRQDHRPEAATEKPVGPWIRVHVRAPFRSGSGVAKEPPISTFSTADTSGRGITTGSAPEATTVIVPRCCTAAIPSLTSIWIG